MNSQKPDGYEKICIICIMLLFAANMGWAVAWVKPPVNIVLKELVAKPSAKSATTHAPVEAELYATSLEIRFNSNLGSQNVVVTNKWGYPVFQQTVNATSGSRLMIDIQSWASGTYTIHILDGQGGGLQGQFVR